MKMELIVVAILVVFIGAFAYVSSTGNHEWSGSDDQAGNVIRQIDWRNLPSMVPQRMGAPKPRNREPAFCLTGVHRQHHHRLFPGLLSRHGKDERCRNFRGARWRIECTTC